jgi:hypothetical protein
MSLEARMKIVTRCLVWLYAIVVVLASNVAAAQTKPFSQQELEQVVAPIALYPDPLVAQVLMASTYPLEVVSAQRWVKANPGVKGKALEDAMQKQPWDASVKSLAAFPQVLDMMNAQLDWTQKLGDAFLAQQQELMAAIQALRARADAAGNLESGKEQVVSKEQQGNTTIVKIEPANPEVVYVPTYNPTVVYGDWPYSAYPPYTYYPPGYVYAPGAALFTFGVGMAVGAALWGNCNWGHGDININSERYNNFNRTNVQGGRWEHNVEHRKGVGYRDDATQRKYGRGQQPGADTREAFRGRAEQGRRDLAQPGASERIQRQTGERGGGPGERGEGIGERGGGLADRGEAGIGERGGGLADRGGSGIGDRSGVGDRSASGIGDRGGSGIAPGVGTRESGLQGVGGRGAETRSFSERGGGSRAAARSGAAGGGARAGGGRAGGGGRR